MEDTELSEELKEKYRLCKENLLMQKDEVYEACMGEDSFHKHLRYTSSAEKIREMEYDEDLIFHDSTFDDLSESIYFDIDRDTFDINKLKDIFNKYRYIVTEEYLEPLHSQALAVYGANRFVCGDCDKLGNVTRCIGDHEIMKKRNDEDDEKRKLQLNNFLIFYL